MKPPIEFDARNYKNRTDCVTTWNHVWSRRDAILQACDRGDAGVSVFSKQEMESLCPTLDHMFRRMFGAMVAAVAVHHGRRQNGRKQLYKHPLKTGATFGIQAPPEGALQSGAALCEEPPASPQVFDDELRDSLNELVALAAHLHSRLQAVATRLNA